MMLAPSWYDYYQTDSWKGLILLSEFIAELKSAQFSRAHVFFKNINIPLKAVK